MCLDSSACTTNDGVTNCEPQQTYNTSETCSSKAGEANSECNIGVLKDKSLDTNDKCKKKFICAETMTEKKKRLPPGYVNCSPQNSISSPNVLVDEKSGPNVDNVSYVNTVAFEEGDFETKTKDESHISSEFGLIDKDTNQFKFGLDRLKPEIPFSPNHESSPIISSIAPPLKQKLSQETNTASMSPHSSQELTMTSRYMNYEISKKNDVIDNAEIVGSVDNVLINKLGYDRSKPKTFSSTSVIEGFCPLFGETNEKNCRLEENTKSNVQSPSKSLSPPLFDYRAIENKLNRYGRRDLTSTYGNNTNMSSEEIKINSSSKHKMVADSQRLPKYENIYPSSSVEKIESNESQQNIKLEQNQEGASNRNFLHTRPSSFKNSNLTSPYHKDDVSTLSNDKRFEGNDRRSGRLHSSSSIASQGSPPNRNSNIECSKLPQPKQYINSAGGGCVSPVNDSTPHVLITSQNNYSSEHTTDSPLLNHRFSVTNPFLQLLNKENESEAMKLRSNNPFRQCSAQSFNENQASSNLQEAKCTNNAALIGGQNLTTPDFTSGYGERNETNGAISTFPQHFSTRQCPSQAQLSLQPSSPNPFNQNISIPMSDTSIQQFHIHHHHFYHPTNQMNNNNLNGTTQVATNNFNNTVYPESASFAFTPPPCVPRPSTNQDNFRESLSQNGNALNTPENENIRLVLKPKQDPLSYKDIEKILSKNKALLDKCGWYYGNIKADESTSLLRDTLPGTFLVRDSSDPKYWFSLSMQRGIQTSNTENNYNEEDSGPTSIRIHFINGKFQLDAEDRIRNIMPEFDTVIDLVQYYVSTSIRDLKELKEKLKNTDQDSNVRQNYKSQTLWVDSSGKFYQTIFLAYPLHKKDNTPTLSHFCRLSINRSIMSRIPNESKDGKNTLYSGSVSKLDLPLRIKNYLEEYPNII